MAIPVNYFVSTTKDNDNYKNLVAGLNATEKFSDRMSDLNIDEKDIDMYISNWFLENTSSLDLYFEDMQKVKNKNPAAIQQISGKILNFMVKNLLKPSNIVSQFASRHNNEFKSYSRFMNGYQNSLLLKQNKLDNEFDITQNSSIELFAKNMTWANRIEKEGNALRKNIISQSCPDGADEKTVYQCGNIYDTLKNKLRTKMLKTEDGKVSCIQQFMDDYQQYIYQDIDKDELLETQGYKQAQKIISDQFSKIKGSENYDITPDSLFKYVAASTSNARLYKLNLSASI